MPEHTIMVCNGQNFPNKGNAVTIFFWLIPCFGFQYYFHILQEAVTENGFPSS